MSTLSAIHTAEQLLAAGDLGRCELIRGELVMMTPAGYRHAAIAARIAHCLSEFVRPRNLGTVLSGDPGFIIARDPDTVRAPDVAFIRAARAPHHEPSGYFPGAPDLAVEVVSPNDRASEVAAKAQAWLAVGSLAVWVFDPEASAVAVHRPGREVTLFGIDETLDGHELLPGFSLPVRKVFAP